MSPASPFLYSSGFGESTCVYGFTYTYIHTHAFIWIDTKLSGLIWKEREKPVFEFMASHGQWGSLQSCASGCDDTPPSSPAPGRTEQAEKGSMNLLKMEGMKMKSEGGFLFFCLPRLGDER